DSCHEQRNADFVSLIVLMLSNQNYHRSLSSGSNSIMASSKYVSKDGRKSLSLDLHASRLFGHKFHNLESRPCLIATGKEALKNKHFYNYSEAFH
ncbi:hypothetical protein ALC62_04076, partial [Cyphomyrmex costatus]